MTCLRSGIDTAALDPAISPATDLYRHVNGRWLDTFEIPADRARHGAFHRLNDEAERQIHTIVTEAAPGSRIGDLYASFMNTDTLTERGIVPLLAELATLQVSKEQLPQVMGNLDRFGIGGAAAWYIDTDREDPTRYTVYFSQAGLSLPDEAYYRESVHSQTLTLFAGHVQRMLELAGWDGPAAQADAQRVLALETALASHHWDLVSDRDANKTNNPMTWEQFTALSPSFDWEAWKAGLQAPAGAFAQVVVCEPSFFTGFEAVWQSFDLHHWHAWLSFHLVAARAGLLTPEISRANFDFFGTVLTGATEQRERWKRGVALVESALGEEVGKEYVARHFPPSHAERMQELVANLIAAYRQSITNLDWMSEQTKKRALEKLAKFTAKIGFPTRWKDYSKLTIAASDLYGNAQRAAVWTHERELAKLGGPVDRDEWFMTPQTVNAYYNPGMNEIVFPAAILQPPFFTADADDAVNYGGIGAVIGHEIGHGFDDQGAKYDGDGRLQDWWTEADFAAFTTRTEALISQYDAYTPAGLGNEYHVNGAFTIGENIGDLGGLGIAIKAYLLSLDGKPAPVIDGLTGMQRLILGFAQVWQQKSREAETIRLLSMDPHSPAEFRCNGIVRNIDAYYDAFAVDESSPWYLPPDQRVRIW